MLKAMPPLPNQREKPDPPPVRMPGDPVPDRLEIGPPTGANRRRQSGPLRHAYPYLLAISTLLAGTFGFLYLTKTVSPAPPAMPAAPLAPDGPGATDGITSAPGDATPSRIAVAPENIPVPGKPPFEHTNLHIRHRLAATGPGDQDLGRIEVEVPALYRSGTVRWNTEDVAKVRSLLRRIGYQHQRSRELREEAVALVTEWDELVIRSIPALSLRADSPSLPENQGPGGSAGGSPATATGTLAGLVDELPPGAGAVPELSTPGDTGVAVVVKGTSPTGTLEAREVRVRAPSPAKPVTPLPAGWKLLEASDAPPFSRSVEMPNGTRLELSIRPHVLVPDADGTEVFALAEPGFDPALGYAQKHTIGAILADSINDLDLTLGQLDAATRDLSELLAPLPAPPVIDAEPAQE